MCPEAGLSSKKKPTHVQHLMCRLGDAKRQGRCELAKGYLKGEAGGLDLLLASHENEDVPLGVTQVHGNRLLHSRVHIILLGGLGEHGLHGEGAPGDAEHWHAAKEVCKLVCVKGG